MSEERIPDKPPKIEALPENEKRPLWSVMIPTYNCTQYLRHTLESVLAQALPQDEMQIEVVDDFSTDADVEARHRSDLVRSGSSVARCLHRDDDDRHATFLPWPGIVSPGACGLPRTAFPDLQVSQHARER